MSNYAIGPNNGQDKQQLADYVSRRVKDIMKSSGVSAGDLADTVHESMGFDVSSARTLISSLRSAHSDLECTYYRRNSYNIPRLSVLLHELGVSEDDEMIGKIKGMYPEFEYPPGPATYEKLKPEEVMPLEQSLARLTPAEYRELERAASRLARARS